MEERFYISAPKDSKSFPVSSFVSAVEQAHSSPAIKKEVLHCPVIPTNNTKPNARNA